MRTIDSGRQQGRPDPGSIQPGWRERPVVRPAAGLVKTGGFFMELATNRRRYSPRLKPLAACLAAALALGAGSVAADPNATSARLQAQDLPLVSTLNGQRPA